jgi:hypothetical protein
VGHRRAAAATDFPVLEPLAEPGTQAPWTPGVTVPRRRAAGARRVPTTDRPLPRGLERRPPARGDPARVDPAHGDPAGDLTLVDPVEWPVPVDEPPRSWRDVLRHVGTVASTVADWLDTDPDLRSPGIIGPSSRSATQGWPRHGSTVVRIVWAPSDLVARMVADRTRWDTLRLSGRVLEPMRYDVGWTTGGRLRLPWLAPSVRVELRIQPAASDRTWAHLLLTSRARFPRQYWTSGHDALDAIDDEARRLVGAPPADRGSATDREPPTAVEVVEPAMA